MTPSFRAQLKTRLAPLLRAREFRGSGVLFRRLSEVTIQLVHFQGSRQGGACCVNLATHLTFLPTVLDEAPDPRTIKEPDCEFRMRLTPDESGDHWWEYGEDEAASARSVDGLIATFLEVGVPHLERHRAFPGLWADVSPEMIERADLSLLPGRATLARAALAMARIADYRSMPRLALDFACVGLADLDKTPGVGLGIRHRLLAIRESLSTGAV